MRILFNPSVSLRIAFAIVSARFRAALFALHQLFG